MAIQNAAGSRITKTQLEALLTEVTQDPVYTVDETIYQTFRTSGAHGSHIESQKKILFHAGQQVRDADIDALFPTATFGSITPDEGEAAGGTDVVITGDNFAGVTGVTVGGVALTDFVLVDDETITGTTGAHAAGEVDVVIADDNANVTATGAFTYTA